MKFNSNVLRYLHYNLDKLNGTSGDKAPVSKGFESIVRDAVLMGHIRAHDYKARTLGKMDSTFFTVDENGEKRMIRLEAKCGCGAMWYFTSDGMGGYFDMLDDVAQVTEDMILPKADYVVFALESDPRYLTNPAMVLDAYVLPRADFIRMLYAMTKHGDKMHIKIDRQRGQVNMQTLASYNKTTGKWSDKPLQRGYDFLDNCEHTETLGEFLQRYGRMVEIED